METPEVSTVDTFRTVPDEVLERHRQMCQDIDPTIRRLSDIQMIDGIDLLAMILEIKHYRERATEQPEDDEPMCAHCGHGKGRHLESLDGMCKHCPCQAFVAEQAQGRARQITEHQALALIEAYNGGLAVVDAMIKAGLNWPPVCDSLQHERWCSEERPCAYNDAPTRDIDPNYEAAVADLGKP